MKRYSQNCANYGFPIGWGSSFVVLLQSVVVFFRFEYQRDNAMFMGKTKMYIVVLYN